MMRFQYLDELVGKISCNCGITVGQMRDKADEVSKRHDASVGSRCRRLQEERSLSIVLPVLRFELCLV